MTRDDIIRMARKANLHERTKVVGGYIVNIPNLENLERFAALVAAAEREACAELCEEMEDRESPYERNVAVLDCAAAIRARGEA